VLNSKKIVVVLPAYNAAQTLEKTYGEIPFEFVDDVVLVDDASRDETEPDWHESRVPSFPRPASSPPLKKKADF
jgi:glycosyltransferase involved in cell wall biosynthesis